VKSPISGSSRDGEVGRERWVGPELRPLEVGGAGFTFGLEEGGGLIGGEPLALTVFGEGEVE
jgi:hypothetical protein